MGEVVVESRRMMLAGREPEPPERYTHVPIGQ
jgi:hypothetical protein